MLILVTLRLELSLISYLSFFVDVLSPVMLKWTTTRSTPFTSKECYLYERPFETTDLTRPSMCLKANDKRVLILTLVLSVTVFLYFVYKSFFFCSFILEKDHFLRSSPVQQGILRGAVVVFQKLSVGLRSLGFNKLRWCI